MAAVLKLSVVADAMGHFIVIRLIYIVASRFVAAVAHQLWMMHPSSVVLNTMRP
jgi:hypothetical protein